MMDSRLECFQKHIEWFTAKVILVLVDNKFFVTQQEINKIKKHTVLKWA